MEILKSGFSDPYKESRPLVSIVIVTYNAAPKLRECLRSIIEHRTNDVELRVFDGESADDTLLILNEFNAEITHWQSEPDGGIYDAMNKAVQSCMGRWMIFLGADDRLLPGFKEALPQLKEDNTLYYADCITDAGVYGGKFTLYQLAKRNICQQGVFYPASIFKKYNFNTKYRVYADYLFNLQCWGDIAFKKIYLPIAVSYYNLTGYSSSTSDDSFLKDKPALIMKYLGWTVYLRYLLRKYKSRRKGDHNFF